jgi:putative flippase GtrA
VRPLELNAEPLKRLLRSGAAGLAATGADLATLALLVAVASWTPREANVPALIVGGIVNFVGNRVYAFHAREGNAAVQAVGYTAVEGVALILNGILYDFVLREIPGIAVVYWLVRLLTTNLIFLVWSYPLWHFVFRAPREAASRG